ncbi:MAG: enoyl-CoA hydratase/isomerase family protein [Betaproteobacteria bacterium]
MSAASAPRFEISGSRAVITLQRPQEHNRIDPDDVPVLEEYLARSVAERSIRAVVITGSGQTTFSSGYTLGAIRDSLDNGFERMLDTLENLPIPVICAMNGSAYGGATDLALCCDIRIGVRGSRMLMPAARFGLHYYPGGMRRYVSVLGAAAAKKLFLTALPIDGDEMLRIGFLTELVDRAALDAAIDRYVEAIEACEPDALATMKQSINSRAAGQVDEDLQQQLFLRSIRSPELARRLANQK